MGPEHSSGRMERFLNLAAEDNLQVVQPTTPAQFFHLLRRQVLRPWRKPLIVFTPKSGLRSPDVVSPLDDLATGGFQRIIPDARGMANAMKVQEIVFCSGKVYYDLAAERDRLGRDDLAVLRLEQIYPLPAKLIEEALAPYPKQVRVRWVQEEPANMGPWPHLRLRFGERLLGRYAFDGVCRPESASPATGSSASHKLEQQILMEKVFGPQTRK
jgi:2-oxoglutarate dehydrogenase E1 component